MNWKGFKPLLASPVDLKKLKYPVFVSPKLDGIRCIVKNGKPVSRSLKPIPNRFIRGRFKLVAPQLNELDGELVVGPVTAKNVFQATDSGVMTQKSTPDFKFYVFDLVTQHYTFLERYHCLAGLSREWPSWVELVGQIKIRNEAELLQYEQICIEENREGIMIRSIDGAYKYGRSTTNEGILLKMKRFTDDEATVVGFEERKHNNNEAKINALGYTERSSHKANKIGSGTLGKLVVKSPRWPKPFKIGTGFDDATRKGIWNRRAEFKGKLVKFKYQAAGVKELPRSPVFLGFRDKRDT